MNFDNRSSTVLLTKDKFLLGQYFTKKEIVQKVLALLFSYKKYEKRIALLEPSFGTGNFISVLRQMAFTNITGCEIDGQFTATPSDFFELPLNKKYDLIVGNPPFTKYNIPESYYYPQKYAHASVESAQYLPEKLIKKDKIQIENAFILKSIQHLRDKNSSMGFVLPISFFIKNKNNDIKLELAKNFSTVIIYQNDQKWFDEPIPCCFAIFTNIETLKDKIVLLYEDGGNVDLILDKSKLLTEELIPKSFLYRTNNHFEGTPLSRFISDKRIEYRISYTKNNVSGANILEKTTIPGRVKIADYCLAVVRVGNSSVGRAGLINIKHDTLNEMFYVFEFNKDANKNKKLKEKLCRLINENQDHFKSLTMRVGSKSIKKEDILNFKMRLDKPQ